MVFFCFVFFFKQKTAYEMRISDWSSDVCSSDLALAGAVGGGDARRDRSGDGQAGGRRAYGSRQAGAIDPAFPRTEARTEDSLCTCHRGSTPAHGVGTGTQALAQRARDLPGEIGREHVLTPVTNAQLVCRLLPENKK